MENGQRIRVLANRAKGEFKHVFWPYNDFFGRSTASFQRSRRSLSNPDYSRTVGFSLRPHDDALRSSILFGMYWSLNWGDGAGKDVTWGENVLVCWTGSAQWVDMRLYAPITSEATYLLQWPVL